METVDGYILEIHRLNPTKSVNSTPVLLLPGFGGSSKTFLTLSDGSIGLTLQDAGYDVWIMNTRGNDFSREHRTFPGDSNEFWDYSLHEIGLYDVSTTIDFMLEKTQAKSLKYIGFSQGTLAAFILLSMKPEYNDKIDQLHLISPGIYMERRSSKLVDSQIGFYVSSPEKLQKRFHSNMKTFSLKFLFKNLL